MKPFDWRRDGIVLAVAMLAPTAFTWLYFIVLQGEGEITRLTFFATKGLLALLPLVWMWRCGCFSQSFRLQRQTRLSLLWGSCFGLLTILSILILYYGWLEDAPSLQGMIKPMLDKLKDAGVSTISAFLVLGAFFCVVNSAFEEYYWRWFVFGRLRVGINWRGAAVISAIAFTSHHILVLWIYIPSESKWWLLPLASGAIGFGGLIWAVIYHKTGSLLGAWIAHGLADIGAYWIGYSLCHGYLT